MFSVGENEKIYFAFTKWCNITYRDRRLILLYFLGMYLIRPMPPKISGKGWHKSGCYIHGYKGTYQAKPTISNIYLYPPMNIGCGTVYILYMYLGPDEAMINLPNELFNKIYKNKNLISL